MRQHGENLERVLKLQGPNGQEKSVKCPAYPVNGAGRKARALTTGWRAFLDENSMKLGDTLAFYLVGPSQFLVRLSRQAVDRKVDRKVECEDINHAGETAAPLY